MSEGCFKEGDKVAIVGDHPWAGHSARLITYERYGLGWMGWRAEVDKACGQECYADSEEMVFLKEVTA